MPIYFYTGKSLFEDMKFMILISIYSLVKNIFVFKIFLTIIPTIFTNFKRQKHELLL